MVIGPERAKFRKQLAARRRGGTLPTPGKPERASEPPPPMPRCKEFNHTWLSLRGLAERGKQAYEVLSSPPVTAEVFELRMGLEGCASCPYCVGDIKKHLHYCSCCKCPRWRIGNAGSDLETKNRHEAHVCPRLPPAWEPAESVRELPKS